MDKIEIITPEAEKAFPILQDAIEREKRMLSQSLSRTQEKVQQLAARLQINPDHLLAGEIPHLEKQDMDLLELEGELEILRLLREQLESLDHLTICS